MNNDPPEDIWRWWDGKLDEWLELVLGPTSTHPEWLVWWEFPTDSLKNEYLTKVHERPDGEIRRLIRRLLIHNGHLGVDARTLQSLQRVVTDNPEMAARMLRMESTRRLVESTINREKPPWEGLTWILDLLPHWPRLAIDTVGAYELAHAQALPDGRLGGLQDVQAIIRARWIDASSSPAAASRKAAALSSLTPREFEHVVEALYNSMGYETLLTPARRDGGRDVEATRTEPSERQAILIECKLYNKPVGVHVPRALLGIVAHENVNKGVVATSSRFTLGSRRLSEADHRIELLDGENLMRLLDSHVGPYWENELDRIIQSSRRRNPNT